jgi:hypothetical protein
MFQMLIFSGSSSVRKHGKSEAFKDRNPAFAGIDENPEKRMHLDPA